MLALLLMNLPVFSQQVVLNSKGDTTICFSIPQTKFMLKQHYKVVMLDSLNAICESQRLIADSIIRNDKVIFDKEHQIVLNRNQVIVLKDHEISNLNLVIIDQKKTIRRQKLYKWLSIIGGGTISSFLGYKYFTK